MTPEQTRVEMRKDLSRLLCTACEEAYYDRAAPATVSPFNTAKWEHRYIVDGHEYGALCDASGFFTAFSMLYNPDGTRRNRLS